MCLCAFARAHANDTRTSIFLCARECVRVCVYVYMCLRVCLRIFVNVRVWVGMCLCVSVRVCGGGRSEGWEGGRGGGWVRN